jgi:two-component system sensor histidine kinase PilS (NtrC family)
VPVSDHDKASERRHDERRRNERRGDDAAFSASLTEDSLFDAMDIGRTGGVGRAETDPTAATRSDTSWGDVSLPADSRFLTRQAQSLVTAGSNTVDRLYGAFVSARAVLGIAVLGAQVVGQALGAPSSLVLTISLVYAVQSVLLWMLPWLRPGRGRPAHTLNRRQWLATIGFDLLAFSAVHALQPTTTFNYVALLVLPALMAGVLTSRLAALATAAAASLLLLAAAWRATLAGADPAAAMTPAGLTGIGLFVVTLLAGELASRLAREEMTARGSLELARQQAQLNRLVIEEMADGVLVVDRRARVRTANPAARRLLAPQGMTGAAPFELEDEPAWAELALLVLAAFDGPRWPEGGRDLHLRFGGGQSRGLRLRARFTRPRSTTPGSVAVATGASEVFCVLFIEDLRSVQSRNRQEKLAAMGRVSAGIAHEIRNPLAAIAQANALLGEDAGNAEQRMLTAMVADNVERLKRIVDDVMEVAPGPHPNPRPIDLGNEVGRIAADWARTSGIKLGADSRVQVRLPSQALAVVFDADHLRRVLVNLLDNARRYASDRSGAIELVAESQGGGAARLSVASDGDPIPPDIEPFLFEPFFSSRSRGTGLGLYICRELCERYGGSIDYWQHPGDAPHTNEFVVTLRVAAAAVPATDADRLLP